VREPQPVRTGQHRPRVRQPVAQRLLRRARGQLGWKSRQDGHLPERVTRSEQVHHPAAIEDLDCSSPDHVQVVEWLRARRHDERAGGEVLDLEPAGQPLQLGGVQRVVRRLATQEVDELLH